MRAWHGGVPLLFVLMSACAQGTGVTSGTGGAGGSGGMGQDASVDGAGGVAGQSDSGSGGASGGAGGSSGSAGGASGGAGGSSGSAGAAGTAGSAGAGGAGPCAGVTCNTPPANACADATHLTVNATSGTCDAGNCNYSSHQELCPNGCENNACKGDPCIGVTCSSPPTSKCSDSTHLTVYEVPGGCDAGQCVYTSHDQYCSFGCQSDLCNGDPCIGVTCASPPANFCSGATELSVYDATGTCSAGACSYTTHAGYCSFGCAAGACTGDPCAGVSCNTPPAPYCSSANTLKTFASSGACSAGNCTYAPTDFSCVYGCQNGVCKDCSTTADCALGKWCNGGTCKTCLDDAHCGGVCTDCTASGKVCTATTCVQCTSDGQCGAGNYCDASNACQPCNTDQKCGATCAICGSNQQCSAGSCQVCKSDSACGASCTACGGSTSHCLDQGSTSKCVQCLGDSDCGASEVCTSNTCGPAGCPPPTDACANGTQSRDRCSGARIIGRIDAGDSNGFSISDDTCYAYDRMNDSGGCYDAGADQTYRIYLWQGETMAVTLTSSWACPFYSGTWWNATLKIFSNTGCGDTACTNKDVCEDYFDGTKNYTAPRDGWYVIVVDGSTAFDDEGDYTLKVKLTCSSVHGCTCT